MATGRTDYLKALDTIQSLQVEQLLLMQERCNNSVNDALAKADAWHSKADAVQVELNMSLGNAHNWYLRATAYEQQLEAMRGSTSWRITAPLRLMVRAIYWPFRSSRSPLSQVLRRGVPPARLWLARSPLIKRPLMAVLNRSPWLLGKLNSLLPTPVVPIVTAVTGDPLHGVIDHAPLTQRGRAIESALREAMIKGQK